MCYEKRPLEGKCNTCLQVYEGLLLLQRCWLLWAFLALPFFQGYWLTLARASDTPGSRSASPAPNPTTLLTPSHVSQALLCPVPHVHTHLHSATPFHVSTLSHSTPPQALLVTHIKLPLAWGWISLLPTINSTLALITYCVSGTLFTVQLKNTCFVFQMMLPMPKKNNVISPSS